MMLNSILMHGVMYLEPIILRNNCSWHVNRAWRKALNTHILDKDERVKVYYQLSVVMFETDLTAFREKLIILARDTSFIFRILR